jgi:hypothetical protein
MRAHTSCGCTLRNGNTESSSKQQRTFCKPYALESFVNEVINTQKSGFMLFIQHVLLMERVGTYIRRIRYLTTLNQRPKFYQVMHTLRKL